MPNRKCCSQMQAPPIRTCRAVAQRPPVRELCNGVELSAHACGLRVWGSAAQWALRVLDNEELGARRVVASAGTSDHLVDLRPSTGI